MSRHTHHILPPSPDEHHPMLELLAAEDEHPGFRRGDVLNGRVALINEDEILVDVGAKFEGIVHSREVTALVRDGALGIGDEVECVVVSPQDKEGNLILSINQARQSQDWEAAEALFNDSTAVDVEVSGHNKGGLIAYVGELRGFIPVSQIDRRHGIDRAVIDGSDLSPLAAMMGQPLTVKVIEIDRRKNRLILSEQQAMREQRKHSKVRLLDHLAEGQVVDGVVTSLADFGAFVDIGGADGLVHLSELAWNRVNHPREVLSLGQAVRVKVIAVDRERRRIGLSIKQLAPEPWTEIAERFPVGAIMPASVSRLADFGAFARLEGDIEGLIHLSELVDEGRPLAEVLAAGDVVMVRVIRVDTERRRIGLSMRGADGEELPPPPAEAAPDAVGPDAVGPDDDAGAAVAAEGADLAGAGVVAATGDVKEVADEPTDTEPPASSPDLDESAAADDASGGDLDPAAGADQ